MKSNIKVVTLNSYHKALTAEVKVGKRTETKNIGRFSRVVTANPVESNYVFDPFYSRDYDAATLQSIAATLEKLNNSYRNRVTKKRIDGEIAHLQSLRKGL